MPTRFSVLFFVLVGFVVQVSAQGTNGFFERDGLKYKMYKSFNGRRPAMGETAMVDMLFFNDKDSLIFNSQDSKQAVPIPITPSQFHGDLVQGVMMLGVGDSAVFLISGDSITKITGQNTNINPHSYLKYVIKLRSIYNVKEQAQADEDTIKAYLKRNKIHGAKRTATGLYYKITQKGKGDQPKPGQTLDTHYTGKLLDGTVFDSDKGAGFSFKLEKKEVIKGWDEAFALLKKGSKATIYLPSSLAYGVQGGGIIGPNTVLIFEVELADIH